MWNLLGPASWPLWLGLITAFAVVTERWSLARVTALAGTGAALLLYVLPTGYVLMRELEAPYARPGTLPADIGDIVVLSGGERLLASTASGRLELNDHGDRISEAVTLAHALRGARLWIVGGVKRSAGRDVDWTADYWRRAGIAPGRIGIIDGTFDTCGNAQGISRVLPGRRVLLVTSGFHMPRAMACMRAADVDAVPYPADRQSWDAESAVGMFSLDLLGNAQRADLALHEYVGLAYYRLRGRIS